jgi:lipopolysaccharide exporter
VELRRQALAGAKWTGAATLASALLQFLQVAVLARLLRPEEFGLMALVLLVVGFAQAFADVGLSGAIVQRQDASRDALSSLFWLNAVAGAVIFAALALSAPLIAAAFGQPRLSGLLVLTALSFLVTPASQQFYAILQKSLAFAPLAGIDLLTALSSTTAAIVSAYWGQGVYAFVWGSLSGAAMRSALLLAIGMKRWRPSPRFRRRDLDGFVRFGIFQMVERTINFVGFNLDKLLIGSLIGVHGLGLYSVAYQLVMKPVQLVTPIVNRVALPVFAMVQLDDARLRSGFLDSMRVVSMLMFPVYMGLIVVADSLVLVLLGPAWQPAVPVLRLLAALGFFYSLGNPIGSLLLAKGRVGLSFLLNVWMLALYALAIVVGATWDVEGVAAGLVIATACGLFPIGFLIRWRLVGMRPAEYVSAFAPALAAALVMAAAVLGARFAVSGLFAPLTELLLAAVLGALVYVTVFVPWQWMFIRRIKGAVR